jgi:hypothetical protein
VGLPFSFEAVDELKKDALLCLYRGLKISRFPRAQHFSLEEDTVCLLMVKDICNAVLGIVYYDRVYEIQCIHPLLPEDYIAFFFLEWNS